MTGTGALPAAEYVSLTTFRRTGQPVATPVWAAPYRPGPAANAGSVTGDGSGEPMLVVWTRADSGKVKRLRHTSRVTVAPCDARGRLLGDAVEATAGLLDPADEPAALAAMSRRYGLRFQLVRWPSHLWGRLTARGTPRHTVIWIRPD
ncbi:PPOX class F420-dependent oxidoreductase [Modestobacter sp. I12A-02628]|uniref:PPOX class F420-dependent oxidoreductase n=1 Tax=Goekera deserti TaxID=2497753 RepID=A0A7K3WB26_9ACTN|nr:PPOX class F420-dependent oxidoreductase [Goekera deserti]MPQ97627.1 PPOX class F420-dependent oxidoreductase [Goekera deserti]NDI47768.1 PPOX class F420-dependent oxidoreductase [Goekera deserti]NEL53516.1 PPOX class F420-dependent oxidoreductase [Goekera deserti]